jgi:DNA-directed RNA polymerase subunit H (RpoH/RPB5)
MAKVSVKWLIKLKHIIWLFLFAFSFQLPRMLESDAIVQYYGLQKGQMVKITYSGEIVDHLVTYRCVT